MAKRMNVDYQMLLKLIKDKVPQKEIMAELGLKTTVQFKNAYLNALIESGAVAKPSSGKGGKLSKINREIKVNNRGSLTVPNSLMIDLGFSPGDTFKVRRSKAGLSLKKS